MGRPGGEFLASVLSRYFFGIASGLTLPQLLPNQRALFCISIFSGRPWMVVVLVIFVVYASGLVKVTWPSPLLGGLLQT